MNFEQFLEVVRALSKSNGFYSRLYESLENADKDGYDFKVFKTMVEKMNFKDEVDVIIWIES